MIVDDSALMTRQPTLFVRATSRTEAECNSHVEDDAESRAVRRDMSLAGRHSPDL